MSARSRGLSLVEVVVVLALVVIVGLVALMALPRGRERARMASCRNNLMQVGVAVQLYDQNQHRLPTVPAPGTSGAGPLVALLDELGLADLTGLTNDVKNRPPRAASVPSGPRRVRSFVCPSDSGTTHGRFAAPVSYRATTGNAPDGANGVFAPGRRLSIRDVEAGDGAAYTAAFSERLVGDGRPAPAPSSSINYALVPGPLASNTCPPVSPEAWRGDAGSSWMASDWTSTLYNHALTPNALSSCIADDRRDALMGASCGHVEGVNVLLLDDSVKTFTSQVNPSVWRAWANIPASAAP